MSDFIIQLIPAILGILVTGYLAQRAGYKRGYKLGWRHAEKANTYKILEWNEKTSTVTVDRPFQGTHYAQIDDTR